jgi:hypothetical protein
MGERRRPTSKDELWQRLPDEDLMGPKEKRTVRGLCSPP